MRNLILLIQKYRNLLFFLFLEFIAISFLFSWKNTYHHSTYISSSNFITSTVWNWKNKIDSYFNLSEINKQLADENAFLKEMLLNKEILLGKNFVKSGDSLFVKAFKFQEATIIQSQFKFSENHILINKGSINGIETEMGFKGTKGIIGRVVNVSAHYANVLPVINADFKLSVIHNASNSWGDLSWEKGINDYRTATINNIPIYAKVNLNDLFTTTGSDGIFPSKIPVGKVVKIEKDQEAQKKVITIELIEDFSNIHVGFVVKNNLRSEMIEIQKNE